MSTKDTITRFIAAQSDKILTSFYKEPKMHVFKD